MLLKGVIFIIGGIATWQIKEGVDRQDLCGPHRIVHGAFGYPARWHGALHPGSAGLQASGEFGYLQSKVLHGLRLHFEGRAPVKMPQQRFYVLA